MSLYEKNFTLKDIFNSRKLYGKLPLVHYREKETEEGKISRRTNMKSVGYVVLSVAKSGAKPYYNPLIAHKSGDNIEIGGNLTGDINEAENAVFMALQASRQLIGFTANNGDMIRSALKEAEKSGNPCKLYLKEKSIQEISGLNTRQRARFMNDIMENIMYGDFPETQKKFNVDQLTANSPLPFETRKTNWLKKVGRL